MVGDEYVMFAIEFNIHPLTLSTRLFPISEYQMTPASNNLLVLFPPELFEQLLQPPFQ